MNRTTLVPRSPRGALRSVRALLIDGLNGRHHRTALSAYLFVVAFHFTEHLLQMAQIALLGVPRAAAGGLLGAVFPHLLANEVLHTVYNSLQLSGLLLLLPGFGRGRARRWWLVALAFQSWHWFEHVFLQVQVLTGHYFYGALKQMSVLERFVPRAELHFGYNLLVFVPTVVALALLLLARRRVRTRAG